MSLRNEVESLISEMKRQNFQATLSQYESRASSVDAFIRRSTRALPNTRPLKMITIVAPNEQMSELTVTSSPGPINLDHSSSGGQKSQAVSPIPSPSLEKRAEYADKIESLENIKNELDNALDKAKAKINELEFERKLHAESDNKKSQMIREYQEELEDIKLERVDLQSQLNKAKFELDNLLARNSLNEKLDEKNGKIIDELTQEYEKLTNEKLVLEERLEKLFKENSTLEDQLASIHTQLKSYQSDNTLLAKKYEQQIHMLDEQVQSYKVRNFTEKLFFLSVSNFTKWHLNLQADNAKIRSENNELTLAQTRNNTELTDYMWVRLSWKLAFKPQALMSGLSWFLERNTRRIAPTGTNNWPFSVWSTITCDWKTRDWRPSSTLVQNELNKLSSSFEDKL